MSNDAAPRNEPHGTAAQRSTHYELFVLGELMGATLHGYHLREILNRVLGPFRQISWGALYPLIHDLEHRGLIVADGDSRAEATESGTNGHPRRPYRITALGQQRFHALMRDPVPYAAGYPEIFMIKLNLFGYIALDEQLAILRHHHAYLQIAVDYLRNEQQFVAERAGIPEPERPHILRLLGYRLSGIQPELAWIDAELSRLVQTAEATSNAHSA